MSAGNYVNFYGIRVEYDPNTNMGVFESVSWVNKGALAYKPITALDIESDLRMLTREAGVAHLEGILRSPVKEDWVPPAGLHGQPANLSAVRTEVNNSSEFARNALVALGEIE